MLKNANVVNVFTGEILPGDVAIADGYIAGVGFAGSPYSGKEELDCTDKYLCPGFIDAHLHIESTMVTPAELVKAVLPSGTTALIADPHEIVNVCGTEGMRFMLEAGQNLPCELYYMLPSSVPSTPFETAGANFTAADMALTVEAETRVIEMVPYQLVTRHLVEQVPSEGDIFVSDETCTKLCVIERHGKNGNITVAPLKGYGIKGGAIATSVAHDSHDIIAAGDNDGDILLGRAAAKRERRRLCTGAGGQGGQVRCRCRWPG